MTRHNPAAGKRVEAHVPTRGDTPGVCGVCPLPLDVPNDRHLSAYPDVPDDARAADHRRLGEAQEA